MTFGCTTFGMYSGFAMIWVFVWIGLVIAIIYFASKFFMQTSKNDPIEHARMRYANGEIDKEKFEEIKNTLTK